MGVHLGSALLTCARPMGAKIQICSKVKNNFLNSLLGAKLASFMPCKDDGFSIHNVPGKTHKARL